MDREKLVRELLYQIRLVEDSSYEFKKVALKGAKIEGPGQKDLADEIAAFANTKGGIILLGVNDKVQAGKPSGLSGKFGNKEAQTKHLDQGEKALE